MGERSGNKIDKILHMIYWACWVRERIKFQKFKSELLGAYSGHWLEKESGRNIMYEEEGRW